MRNFVVATPNWSPHHHHAQELERRGLLRLHAYAGRRVRPGVNASRTAIHPVLAGLSAAFMRFLPQSGTFRESARFALSPHFDRWARKRLREGDNLITSYGYANACMRWVRCHGGTAILDAGNSHPDFFWEILSDEHRRWGVDVPPVSKAHHRRAIESADAADWVIGLSRHVTESFIERGFPADRTFVLPRPVNLEAFKPRAVPRDPEAPLTLISTGGANLRKGTPYLFEALKKLQNEIPGIKLKINSTISPTMKPLLGRYNDLRIEWMDEMDPSQVPSALASGDLFLLPSLEEGFARAAAEAMACGLPVILTPNTGVAELIEDGVNGSIIPIRDAEAIRDAVLVWWEKIKSGVTCDPEIARRRLSMESFQSGWSTLLERF